MATLRTHRPLMIAELAQTYLAEFGDSVEALLDLLHGLGYEFSLETDLDRRLATPAEVIARLPPILSINVICWPPVV
jgi:hypothetical protein